MLSHRQGLQTVEMNNAALPAASPHARDFLDAAAGQVWQRRHFSGALNTLSTDATAQGQDALRSRLRQSPPEAISAEIFAQVVEEYCHDMVRGFAARHAALASLRLLPPARGTLLDGRTPWTLPFMAKFAADLRSLDPFLQLLFLEDLRSLFPVRPPDVRLIALVS